MEIGVWVKVEAAVIVGPVGEGCRNGGLGDVLGIVSAPARPATVAAKLTVHLDRVRPGHPAEGDPRQPLKFQTL